MPVRYKVDVMAKLKEAGYTTYRIRKEKIMGERTLQQIRGGELVSWANIATLCSILNCQPGDIVEFVQDDSCNEDGESE